MIKEIAKKIKEDKKNVISHYRKRIERYNTDLNALITLTNEDFNISSSERKENELNSIPMVAKDNISVKGLKMTSGSKILSNYSPVYNSTIIDRLNNTFLLGKANLDSFTFGSSTENSYFGVTKNPWDKERVSGGSSGGSAASVASNLCVFAIGTDTGGSIRQPASFCGVVGLKPTYGALSRYGNTAMGSSLDCPGFITHTVEDASILLEYSAGYDPHDATTSNNFKYSHSEFTGIKNLKIGIPTQFFKNEFSEYTQGIVKQKVMDAISMLEKLGAKIIDLDLPFLDYALTCYYIITPSEISSNMARYDGIRFGYRENNTSDIDEFYTHNRSSFEEEVKRRIFLGNFSLSSGYQDKYYVKACQLRSRLNEDITTAFEKVDILVGPTSPTTAFKIGERTNDPLSMYLSDIYTIYANIAKIPSISIPCGISEENLPIGIQLSSRMFNEKVLLNCANALEVEIDFRNKFILNCDNEYIADNWT